MKRARKFIGLAAIAAVLNPLCCCFADAVAAALPAKETAHSCCAQPQQASVPEQTSSGGCPTDEGCPHKQIADAREIPAGAHVLAAPQPAPAPVFVHTETLIAATGASQAWAPGEQRPPGRHDPPAWLRSHSFLN
jgi:hypothetical protein